MKRLILILTAVAAMAAAVPAQAAPPDRPKATAEVAGPVGTAQYGQTVSFTVTYDIPRHLRNDWTSIAYLFCSQNGTLVHVDPGNVTGAAHRVFDGIEENPLTATYFLGDDSSSPTWTGGAASCYVSVYVYEWKAKFTETDAYEAARLDFEVAA